MEYDTDAEAVQCSTTAALQNFSMLKCVVIVGL